MALRSGYKGFKKLLPGLKVFRPGTLGIDNDVLIPELNKTFFPRSEQAVLGAFNILDVTGSSTTTGGVPVTVNADKSITFGNATATSGAAFVLNDSFVIKAGTYTISRGVSANVPSIFLQEGSTPIDATVIGTGETQKTFTLSEDKTVSCRAWINNNTAYNGTIYPMIYVGKSVPNPPYAPFAMTNRELTENKVANSVIAPVENGNTSSQAYNVGDYFIRNNLICKANRAISAGETLVAGSTHSTSTLGLFMNKYLILDGSYVQTLSNESDLNDLIIGEARVSNTDAPSILNRPSEVTTSFFIITIQIWGSEYLRQILFARDTANIYTRVKASTWGNWYKVGLTQV